MRAGWVGLGKLGLPCALALAAYGGHDVTGYDVSPVPGLLLAQEKDPGQEQGLADLIWRAAHERIGFRLAVTVAELVAGSDVIVVAVQTPHDPDCDGTGPAPEEPSDFSYDWLRGAVSEIAYEAARQRRPVPLIVLSTVLPGTMDREIVPLAGLDMPVAYSPAFISLGSAIRNFIAPDFHLAGRGRPAAADAVRQLYAFTGRPVIETGFATAELIKMSVNMMDTLKITFANFTAELADGCGADADQVAAALRLHRAGRFPDPGMPDGGPCRPRDLIALSYLARTLGTSSDLPGLIGRVREFHAGRIAALADELADGSGLGVVLAGKAYKPESDLADGSPALLVRAMLKHDARIWDVPCEPAPQEAAVFVVCTRYRELAAHRYPQGSAVLDPWGITVPGQPGVRVVRPGRCAP